jgi:NAD(P)-dependent dehydrogenase (short-subunit alcohol dehydrogenase family)
MQALKDHVAVVTGAAGGIGSAIATELARAGMHVVLADIDESGMRATAAKVEAMGRRTLCVPTDVTDLAAIEHLLERALSEFGACHLIVNNAGVFHGAAMLEAPIEQWRRVVAINLWGVIYGSYVFGNHFVKQGQGHIVNTSSAAGLFPVPGMSSYSTTKFAVFAFSRQLRWELAAAHVGVTVLCPGVIKTGIGRAAGAGLEHVDVETLMKSAPAPEGLARAVVRAVRRNRAMVRYAPDAYVLSWLRMLPTWLLEPLGRFMARVALTFVRPPQG